MPPRNKRGRGWKPPRDNKGESEQEIRQPSVSIQFLNDDDRNTWEEGLVQIGRLEAFRAVAASVTAKTMTDWEQLLGKVGGSDATALNAALLQWLSAPATPESPIIRAPGMSTAPSGLVVP